MSKLLAYAELLAEITTPNTAVSVSRPVTRGVIVGCSIHMITSGSQNTVGRAIAAFSSLDNANGAPGGMVVQGPVSLLSGVRWDGKIQLLPNMQIILNVNAADTAIFAATFLIETEFPDNSNQGGNPRA
jgi:hypothetical protein